MNTIMQKNTRAFSIGLLLAIAGINMMAILKLFLGANLPLLSIGVSVLSLLLIINYHSLTSYHKPNIGMLAIILYSIYTLIMAGVSGIPFMETPYGFIYQAFYFLLVVALWNNTNRLDEKQIATLFVYTMGIFSFLALFFILKHQHITGAIFFNGLGYDEFGREIITRHTPAQIGFTLFISLLAFGKYFPKLRLFLLLPSITIMLLGNRRTVYGALILILLFHMRNIGWQKMPLKRFLKYLMVILLIVISLIVFYMCNNTFRILCDHAFNSLYSALGTYFGSTNNFDLSASYRRAILETIPYKYFFNSTFTEFVFGRGYMNEWLDIPIIQAFWDLGLIGGIVFFMIQFVLPIKYFIQKANSPLSQFAQYLLVLQFLANFNSGLPYGVFFPLTFMMLVCSAQKKHTIIVEEA